MSGPSKSKFIPEEPKALRQGSRKRGQTDRFIPEVPDKTREKKRKRSNSEDSSGKSSGPEDDIRSDEKGFVERIVPGGPLHTELLQLQNYKNSNEMELSIAGVYPEKDRLDSVGIYLPAIGTLSDVGETVFCTCVTSRLEAKLDLDSEGRRMRRKVLGVNLVTGSKKHAYFPVSCVEIGRRVPGVVPGATLPRGLG
jgi:hypothetical protein